MDHYKSTPIILSMVYNLVFKLYWDPQASTQLQEPSIELLMTVSYPISLVILLLPFMTAIFLWLYNAHIIGLKFYMVHYIKCMKYILFLCVKMTIVGWNIFDKQIKLWNVYVTWLWHIKYLWPIDNILCKPFIHFLLFSIFYLQELNITQKC